MLPGTMASNLWTAPNALVEGWAHFRSCGYPVTPILVLTLVLLGSVGLLIRGGKTSVSRGEVNSPPGNTGLPIVGNTMEFLNSSPNDFYRKRAVRYGDIFKSKLFGNMAVSVASPEAAKFVLATEQKKFCINYAPSFKAILGPENLTNVYGDLHLRMRKMIQAPIVPESLRARVPWIDATARAVVNSWKSGDEIISRTEGKKYAFQVALSFACNLEGQDAEILQSHFELMEKGLLSLAINFPGTTYYRGLMGRAKVCQILDKLIARRREGKVVHKDILDSFLNHNDEGGKLTDAQIKDGIITVLFAGHDTSANVLVWTIKYLSENPHILEEVREEHLKIRSVKDTDDELLNWGDTKAMPVTLRLMQETMRVANVVPFTWREALEDVEYNGYLIPRGWKVMVWFNQFHLSPAYYKDPLKFNPSRFEHAPKPHTYIPFGTGLRVCPGSELAKLEILVFIHRLVTTWSWEMVAQDTGVEYFPLSTPRNGAPIKLKDRI